MATAEPHQFHFPTRSIDVFIPIEEGTSKHAHLQILRGDITTENTQAVVVFRASDDTVEGDSLRVLQVAGQGIDDEYQRVKAQRGDRSLRVWYEHRQAIWMNLGTFCTSKWVITVLNSATLLLLHSKLLTDWS